MESEKVKEIKELLLRKAKEYESQTLLDILTLINELESENERFAESCKNCHYIKDIEIANGHARELKDRIAELEKENDELASKFIDSYNDSLKDFAEKVKNKLFEFFQDNEGLDGKISVGVLYVDVIGVEAKDGTIISLGLIDELLKEYEKWHDMKVII